MDYTARMFVSIYPKNMTLEMLGGLLTLRLHYTIEQYGMLTGPFEISAQFHPDELTSGVDPWEIISNTRPKYNSFFEHFFSSMQVYLREVLGLSPVEDVLSGQKRFFELHFPDILYNHDVRAFEPVEKDEAA